MSNTQPEPSMEEILASIRRIISEDDEETRAPQTAPTAAQPRPRPQPAPTIQPAPVAQPRPVQPEPQLVVRPAPEPQRPAPQPQPRPQPQPAAQTAPAPVAPAQVTTAPAAPKQVTMTQPDMSEQILSETAVAAASKAFQSLTQKVKVTAKPDGRSLEDIVTDLLRPMIKDWLDAHLPAIVEEKVDAEVKRLSRQGR